MHCQVFLLGEVMRFYLGTHEPSWLRKARTPLFISAVRLRRCKTMPIASVDWALDSGGFSELSIHGLWKISRDQYAEEVRQWSAEIGRMEWAAIQDWMCEPFILEKTGKSVEEHQRLTIQSYKDLTATAPEIRWIPILQGFRKEEYLRHIESYLAAGVDLKQSSVVGIGSICRRQHTKEAEDIITTIASLGIRLHWFGFKTKGLERVSRFLVSSDSMAWSFAARRNEKDPNCQSSHKSCANCRVYAENWAEKVNRIVKEAEAQGRLF